jgi:DNA-binding beta-propeller fold protein YncE
MQRLGTRRTSAAILAVAVLACIGARTAQAQLAVSVNDAKIKLVEGRIEVQKSPQPDTISVIDLRATPPKIMAQIEVPGSVFGSPLSVAISPREDFALVTSGRRIDPADPTKLIPDDRVTVVDLTPLKPGLLKRIGSVVGVAKGPTPVPKVLTTLQAGMGASGVSINKTGTLALVANHDEGTVSVFSISGSTVTPAGKVAVGGEKSGPSHVAFSLDGKHAFVTRAGDNRIVVLSVDRNKVELTKREMAAGLRPQVIDVAPKSAVAVVSNAGLGLGDADTISVIDLKTDPQRVVSTVSVGQSPQGLKVSPDGKFVAVTLLNGTDKPANSPFYNSTGLLQVWARNGTQLTKAAELPIGKMVPRHRMGTQQS